MIQYRENLTEADAVYHLSPPCDHPAAYRIYMGGKIVFSASISNWNDVHKTLTTLRRSDRSHLLVSDLHIYQDTHPKMRSNYGQHL